MIHPKLRKMGLYLPTMTLDDHSPIEVENTEDFEMFVQLDNNRAVRIRSVFILKHVVLTFTSYVVCL